MHPFLAQNPACLLRNLMPETLRLDVCVLADVRVGDNAAPCHAAALAALAEDGYRVGVIAIAPDGIACDPYTVEPEYAQLFQERHLVRVSPDAKVECTLALAFDSRIFSMNLLKINRITSKYRIVTVERPHELANTPRAARDHMAFVAEHALGGAPLWAPSTIISRDALSSSVPHWPQTATNWQLVVPRFTPAPKTAVENARPAVGFCRTARSRSGAWHEMGDDPARMFETPVVSWHIRAGPDVPSPAWPQPAPVEFWSDDALTLTEFLAGIDILANPDVAEKDPCPVEALCALRAGVIPYLPPEYRPTFGGAALYGRPEFLTQIAIDFQDDRGFASDLRANGQAAIGNVFSETAFVDRVADLIGPPRKDAFAPVVHARSNARVLFYSSNGVGMGHLTRQLAIARRLPGDIEPVFISHSQAVEVVREFGYVSEHIPYHTAYGEAPKHWNAALTDVLDAAVAFYRPSALVYDGNVPFVGLMAAFERTPSLARVWIRRGMWGKGRDIDALNRSNTFDLVIEPGEFAGGLDDGPTADRKSGALCVSPVHILDIAELHDRATACAILGLDPTATNVLIAPGSGNNFDTGSISELALSRLRGRHGIGIARADWKIANTVADVPSDIAKLTEYPFARFHKAFDFAIAAAGYNTFAEHLASALPTIWTPNEHAQQDRQILRATYAEAMGLGRLVRVTQNSALGPALETMLDPRSRRTMQELGQAFAKRHGNVNGGVQAAEAIAGLCQTTIDRR